MGFNRRAENTRLQKHVVLNYQLIRIPVISWPVPSINVKFIPTLFVKNIFPKLVSVSGKSLPFQAPHTNHPPPPSPPNNKHIIEVEIASHFNGTNFKTDQLIDNEHHILFVDEIIISIIFCLNLHSMV